MKSIKKIIILFIFLFICINPVNAAFSCGGGKKEVIKEVSKASPNGWNAVMNICVKYEFANKWESISREGTYITAQDAATEMEERYFDSADGKGYTTSLVPRCNDDDHSYVSVNVYCTHTVFEAATEKCATKEVCSTVDKTLNSNCKNYTSKGSCEAKNYCNWFQGYETAGGIKVDSYCYSDTKKVEECEEVEDKDNCEWVCPKNYEYFNNPDAGYINTCKGESPEELVKSDRAPDNVFTRERFAGDSLIRAIKETTDSSGLSLLFVNCRVQYEYMCALYECVEGLAEFSTCSPAFKNANGKTTYCVNPGQPFSSQKLTTAEYQADPDFNVNECKNSFSTVDCGYANILIEGAYHNLSDNAINLALRLWGAYTGQSGFNRIGLSYKHGATCSADAGYRSIGGEIPNVYKRTYRWAISHFFDNSIKQKEYINAKSDITTFMTPCVKDKSMVGVACGEGNIYKQAIGLLFNTILGNKDMHNHLREYLGETINTEPDTVNIKSTGDGYSYVTVYTEELDEILEKGKTVICVDEKGKKNPENLPDSIWKQVEPYCSVTTTVVDEKGQPIKLFDKNGNLLPQSMVMDKCVKGSGCFTKQFAFAICDVTKNGTKKISVRTTYNTAKSSKSIKKYWSCENPNKNQVMFAFDGEKAISQSEGISATSTTKEVKEYPIINYQCTGSCTDYNVQTDLKNSCSNNTSNYNGVYKSSIKDPSLKCIVNMANPDFKELYDYSDYFKVNKNFCRVFCSDEVEFYIADKVKEKSGRTFNYDIEFNVNKTKKVSYQLTNIVKAKRSCVSEIYYNKNFTLATNWKKLYGLTDAQAKNVTNWQTLFKVIIDKASTENGRTENINQLLYDLYNCNMIQDPAVYTSKGITKPKESILSSYVGNSFDYIIESFSEKNNYGLGANSNCIVDNKTNTNTCVKMNNINYNYGGNPDGKSVNMKSYTSSSNTFNNVVYCSGKDCFKYDASKKEDAYNYPTASTKSTGNMIIGNQMRTIEIVGNHHNYIRFNGRMAIAVPVNDYALFEVSTEIDYFNADQYEVTPGDGKVYKKGSVTNQQVMPIDKYSYTLNQNAYNSDQCTRLDDKTNRCTITQSFSNMKLFYRKSNSDGYTSALNNTNKMKFTCYVDVEKPTVVPDGDKTIYRNVNPADLFPYSTACKNNKSLTVCPTNTNNIWYDNENVISEIEQTAELLKGDQLLEYKISLTPTQIKNIQEYNKNGNYNVEGISNCDVKDGIFYNCKSTFLNRLRASTADAYGSLGTLDKNYSTGESKYTRSKKN